ncbi:MAG: LamG domain-containing protein [Chryseolinea sp.]
MKSIFLGLLLFFLCTKVSIGQTDNVGSGRAVEFDGVDDYIEFGNRYSDLTFPFTISAWVYLKPSSRSSPIFVSRNNDPLYSGFWFTTYSDFIFIEYGDGFGGNNPAFRRGKKANVTGMTGRWNHVSAVVRGLSDIDIYLNGVNVGNETTGDSNSPMNSNISGGHSTAGYFLSNGVTYNCTGIIDDIRLWNKALSQEEIRKTMCVNLIGNESGLIGYWDFNEISGDTIYDKSSNKFHGKFIGNPTRVFSGAPIGDVSTFQYSTAWSGKTISLVDGDHKIDVKKINGNVEGIQIYEVKNAPSQATGLDLNSANKPYFGVFLVSQNAGATFDANYYFQGNGSCELFLREDNSISVWAEADNPVINKLERGEFEKGFGNEADFELGANKILCDQSSYEISTGIIDPQFTFQWNTGQNTSSIAVSETGLYSVDVFGYCGTTRDSITFNFEKM